MPKNLTIGLEYLSPDKLVFDPENPRLAGQFKGKTQPEIQRAIMGDPHYASELVDSFIENGFIAYEPLVVRREGDHFTVVEGNRRLAAVKEIRGNPEKYPNRKSDLDSIPAIVFPDKVEDQQGTNLRVYLGVRHLMGFREWPPLAKAQFLELESKKVGGLDGVIKEVRITKQQARRFLLPYRLLNDASIRLPGGEDFWVLGEALSRTGVKKFLQLDVDSDSLEILGYSKSNLKLLLDDLYGPREGTLRQRDVRAKKVRDTRELSTYSSILSSDKAAAALHSGKSLDEAAIYVDTREQSQKRLQNTTKSLGLLIRKLVQNEKAPEAAALHQAVKQLDVAVKAYLKKHA